MCKLSIGEAEAVFVTYLEEEIPFSKQKLISLTWEAHLFSQEEVDEEMFPPHLLESLPEPFLLSCAMEEDAEGRPWVFSLVERPDKEGYIAWADCQESHLGTLPIGIFHDGTVQEIILD